MRKWFYHVLSNQDIPGPWCVAAQDVELAGGKSVDKLENFGSETLPFPCSHGGCDIFHSNLSGFCPKHRMWRHCWKLARVWQTVPWPVVGCPWLSTPEPLPCAKTFLAMSFWRLGAGPSSACSSRSRPRPRSSIAPRWWPSCSRCAEAALGINGFQVISDVTVVSLLLPLYTQPKLESFSFTPTLKSFEWQCEPKLVLARTLAITCRLIAGCHTCPAIWFSLITAYCWNTQLSLARNRFFHFCRPEVSGVLLVIGGVCGNSMGHHLRIAFGRGDLPLRSNCCLHMGTPDGSHQMDSNGA